MTQKFTIDEFAKTVIEADESSAQIPFWTPAEGDVIIGRITSIKVEEGDFGPRKVYTVYNELLESYVRVPASTILSARMEEYGVRVGDRVGIKYLGKKKGKNKREYNLYAVFVDEENRQRNAATAQTSLPEEESPF